MANSCSSKNILISFLYIMPIAIAIYGMREMILTSIAYLAYSIVMYLSVRYLVCTKCDYYGRQCLLFGGIVAAMLFKKREGEWRKLELRTVTLLWGILYLSPIIVLSYMRSWFLILFIISVIIFNLVRIGLGCKGCEMKERCPMAHLCSISFHFVP